MELSINFSVVVEAVVGVGVVDDVDEVVSVAEVVVAATNDAVTTMKYRESIIFSMAHNHAKMWIKPTRIFLLPHGDSVELRGKGPGALIPLST